MKIKVKNSELPLFNAILKVKSLNYDMVIAKEDNEAVALNIKDVELIAENEFEELILSYRDILKIKLCKDISPVFYSALIGCIEERIGERLNSLEVLNDNYKISGKGIYEKKITLVANNQIPLDITVVGMKYSEEFSITFKDITLQSFIDGCNENIRHLRKEIEEKEKSINRYKNILKEVMKNSINLDNKQAERLISC
ncbi:hypothetical protein M2651_11090 [Clostridium sp. SYSU_GA19001]|uniref:hypothetical protein n=1 Tax=Clostridium caldaquaticum TaxID=2940653 RepID=UPI0020772ACF|nr:hypothetical protein [Clostridium caldaquaticum]MCM8711564.1 hypothetical protein [Clostridium caldaquaticum]